MKQDSTFLKKLEPIIAGDISCSADELDVLSHDASLFEIRPELAVYPKDSLDICRLVEFVNAHKSDYPRLSLTARSGGTDMSGGAINDSIVVGFNRYFNNIGPVKAKSVTVEPGVYYRDLEPKTLEKGLLLPSYPASREICMVGGMISNNAGGEKSLVYGKTEKYVERLKIVLSDGKEHQFTALTKAELDKKMVESSFEGEIYTKLFNLIQKNQNAIKQTRPKVSKNSTAYNVWDVWDGVTFDINKLFVGSQGTLGLITETTFKLVTAKPLSGMVVAFLPSLKNLGEIINLVLPLKPTSMESFDDHTLLFAFRFFLTFRKTLGWKKFMLLGLSFIPVLNKLLKYFPHLPKIVLLVEFEGSNQEEINRLTTETQSRLDSIGVETQLAKDKEHEEKFWTIRRESFNLLRKNVKRKHTAPFIDDLVVPPKHLPEFLPRLIEILERYKLLYTIAGHMGDGNFHIIPLMDLTDTKERAKIYPALEEVTDLVLEYEGSLSGEHNDGLIRGPLIERMYGSEMLEVFKEIKDTFDPRNIFNPHKKTDATMEYSKNHIRGSF